MVPVSFLTLVFLLQVIEKWMDRDYFMTAEEAVSYGIVDRVLHKAPAEKVDENVDSKSPQ